MKKGIYVFLVLLLSGLGFSSCTASREREVATDIESFRDWVDNRASHLADFSEQEWKSIKEDFKVRTRELDKRQEQLSEELKVEYKQLKQRFKNLDKDWNEQVALAKRRRELLGEYADMSTINAANVVDAYSRFLENVRAQHKEWSDQDWDKADKIFEELNDRKASLKSALPTEDEVKIKALQMEYTTLETTSKPTIE